MKMCDLHCDTALELYRQKAPLADNKTCAISLAKTACYDTYVQAMAVFTSTSLDNEQGWEQFFAVRAHLLEECGLNNIPLCATPAALSRAVELEGQKTAFVLTVEDCRILNNHPERLDILAENGVSLITPLWGGETCLGGSHNTAAGLSSFGKAVVERAFCLGMAVDLSHASFASADDILDIAERRHGRVLASHSNAYALCGHSRNLTDDRMRRLASLGGVIGLNLCVPFLTATLPCTAEDVLRHAEYIVETAGEDVVAFGADWDGAGVPEELATIDRMTILSPLLRARGWSESAISKLFFDNAFSFLTARSR